MSLRTALIKYGRPFSRTYATEGPRENFVKNVKGRMEHFQMDNEIPVYIKGGFMDQVLYRGTAVLAVGGFFLSIYTVIQMVFKKK